MTKEARIYKEVKMISSTMVIKTGGQATLICPHKHKNQVLARAATASCKNWGPEETEELVVE